MFKCKINETELHEGQFVVVKTIKINDNIVTVQLIEYNNVEGLIMPNELSRKRIKNATQATKINKTEVCQILKIENKHIDLSLKQVDENEKANALELYKQNKLAYSIAEKIAKKIECETRDVYETYKEECKKYGSLFNLFGAVKENSDILKNKSEIEQCTIEVIKNEFKASTFKLRADIDVTCSDYNGLNVIKASLASGCQIDSDIEICLLNTPTFSVTKTCTNKEEGFNTLNRVIDAIRTSTIENGGEFSVMSPPRIYGEKSKHNMLSFKAEEINDTSSDSD